MGSDEEREFEAFFRAHGDRLIRFARLIFLDDGAAEDAVQVALSRTAKRWRTARRAPYPYVRAAIVNLVRDDSRRRHRWERPVDISEHEPGVVADHADAVAARAHLDDLLSLLPPRQRAAVVLRVLDGQNEADAAQLLGCSVGAVKSNLSRGLQRLRAELAEPEPTEATNP